MNKIKALLIAGLLSLSSVSFASTVTFIDGSFVTSGSPATATAGIVADGTKAGTISLDLFSPVTFTGTLADTAATTSAWYELTVSTDSTGVAIGNSTGSVSDSPLAFELWGAATFNLDGVLTGFADLKDSGSSIATALLASGTYYLNLIGPAGYAYSVDVNAVPVPAAGILFASALLGAGAIGRRKKKAKASVVGAFARAS